MSRSKGQKRRRSRTQLEIKQKRAQYRKALKEQRERELATELEKATSPSLPNRKSAHATIEEEKKEREEIANRFLDVLRPQLPGLIASLSEIKDFRNPKKVEHQLLMVLFYGLLCFVFQISSRREANRKLTGPVLLSHLKELFPEIEKLPHQDTLNRILSNIDVESIQDAHVAMIRRLIRNKKFDRWLIRGYYPIAIDGTQKHVRREQVSVEWLQRRINAGKDNESTQYYVYVLEANLVFPNGISLPLMTEFLNYTLGDTDNDKQDCETKAFHRLAQRLKEAFPRLKIMLLLDGLYPNGPILHACRQNRWQFMIVLQDKSLPTVWEDYEGLKKLEPDMQADLIWKGRKQHFQWVNDIEYYYDTNQKKKQIVHLVVCEEYWVEIDPETNAKVEKSSRHAWISSEPLTKNNLHERCNLAARHRWAVEEDILVEKHHGYRYEHCFSFNWNAMKGYHYLMRIGHALNILIQYSEALAKEVRQRGVRAFIDYIRETFTAPWVDPLRLKGLLNPSPQLRLV